MTTLTTPDAPAARRSLRTKVGNAPARERTDFAMRSLLLFAVACAVIPLFIVIGVTVQRGLPAFGWEFLTSNPPFNPTAEGGGYLPMIFGTIYMTAIAVLLAVPLGVTAAIFLVEYRESKLVPVVRFFTDVMTGVPSIFVGLFVFSSLVISGGLGFGTLPGAVGLAVLMLPIVVRSSEEVLRLVPQDLRNAAYGLGARRRQVVTRVVLPAAGPGLATSSMLAVARGAGETAPLLLTALGARALVTDLVGRPQGAIPLQVLEGARGAFQPAIARAWAGALTLMLLVLLFTIGARLIARRSQLTGGN
ncbi:phosphate ABC transporter permease PstA [Egicoccus halophilus]|nr:phosphate ABC transporter permease PstA [Egicoccus halophilus]